MQAGLVERAQQGDQEAFAALAAASVLWGMALSTRALGARPKAPWLLDLHRFLGGMTVLFVGAHFAIRR